MPLDARLKQRLVGAALLLALIVIVVPMFFSAHEQGGNSTTSVSLGIPAQPQPPVQSKTFVLGVPSVASSARAERSSSDVVKGTAVAHTGGSLPTVTIPGAPLSAGSAALPSAAPGFLPQVRGVAGPAIASTARVSRAAKTVVVSNGARMASPTQLVVPKVPNKSAPLPPGTAAEVTYVVSLGAYTNLASARALAARVSKLDVPVGEQSMRLDGKPAIRIYVGPYADRALAEAARLRIHVAEPRTTAVVFEQRSNLAPGQADQTPFVGKPGGWVVQLGAFNNAEAAMILVKFVRAAGFPAYSDRLGSQGTTLWRVRVGPELTRDRAAAVHAQIKAKLGLDGVIAVAH